MESMNYSPPLVLLLPEASLAYTMTVFVTPTKTIVAIPEPDTMLLLPSELKTLRGIVYTASSACFFTLS